MYVGTALNGLGERKEKGGERHVAGGERDNNH